MSELSLRMELFKVTLQAFAADRVVTRDLIDFANRTPEELKQGVYTVVSKGESGYANFTGRMAAYGTQGIAIIGQIQVEEDDPPSAIEDAEGEMIEEIKQFANSQLPPGLGSFTLLSVNQSQQLEHPYGWVLFDSFTSED